MMLDTLDRLGQLAGRSVAFAAAVAWLDRPGLANLPPGRYDVGQGGAVGIGEAASGGPSQALLADVFPPEKRARAMSILATATFSYFTHASIYIGTIWDR